MSPGIENVKCAVIDARPLDVAVLTELVSESGVGGTVVFIGAVRDHDEGKQVTSLSYSAHPSAEALLAKSAERVAVAHPHSRLAVAHRVGDLVIGDLAVVVAAGAVHRAEAFAAARALIDDVKSTVPIWKHQRFDDGSDEWVGLP